MAASNPNGEMQFWKDGKPFGGIQLGSNDGGEMRFWGNGKPYPYLFPTAGSSPSSSVSLSPSSSPSASQSPSSSVSLSPSSSISLSISPSPSSSVSKSLSSSISPSPSLGTPNTTFLEPGGDADFLVGTTNGFWSTNTGSVVVATDFVHGGHIKSLKYATGSDSELLRTGVLADAGTRISFYIYLKAYPNADANTFLVETVGGSACFSWKITSTGALKLNGTAGTVLSLSTWYRVSLAYTITSSTVNRFEMFLDGVSYLSQTNVTISAAATSRLRFGNIDGNSTFDMRSSDHYIDDSSSLTDPGNIWVTAKRPNANGTINNFNVQIGAGGSGYGSGHSPQVNERPLSTTNGWSVVGAGSAVTEEYNIESAATGDIDISTAAIADVMGWVSASSVSNETASIIVMGATSNISLTSTATLFKKFANSTTYPAGTGTDIGIVTDTTVTTVGLYEAGILIAYVPSAGSSPSSSISLSPSASQSPSSSVSLSISPSPSSSISLSPSASQSPSSSVSLSISPSPSSSISLSPSISVSSSISPSPSSSQSPSSSVSLSISLSPSASPSPSSSVSSSISLSPSASPSPSSSDSPSPSLSISLSPSVSASSSLSSSTSSSVSASPSSSQSPSSSESPSPSPSNAPPVVVTPQAGRPKPQPVRYDATLYRWDERWIKARLLTWDGFTFIKRPLSVWDRYWKSVDIDG